MQAASTEVVTSSTAAPVLEDTGFLGKAAKFISSEAGGALLGVLGTVAENADYSSRSGLQKYVAAATDTTAGAVIGTGSTIASNVAAGAVDVTETVDTDGVGAVAVPVIHVAVAGTTSALLSGGGNYVYSNYIRTPLINGITDVLSSAYSTANSLLNYGNGR